jgi:hypothetical protein
MVPMLDGTNWTIWSSQITSLFMAKGLWDIVCGDMPRPLIGEKEKAHESDETRAAWTHRDYKAYGILRLKVVTNLHSVFSEAESSQKAWELLKAELGKPGTAEVFANFLVITHFKLSGGNPETEFAKLSTHIAKLAANGVELPKFVPAMTVLANVPAKWDHIAARITSSSKIVDLSVAGIRSDFVNEYQRTSTSKAFAPPKEKAQKISAVCPYQGNPKWKGMPYQRDNGYSLQQQQGSGSGSNQQDASPAGNEGGQKRQKKGKGKGKSANATFINTGPEASPHAYQGEARLAPTFENPAVSAISLAHRLAVQPSCQSVKQLMGAGKTEDPRRRPVVRSNSPLVAKIVEVDQHDPDSSRIGTRWNRSSMKSMCLLHMKQQAVGVPDCTIQKSLGPCKACAEGNCRGRRFLQARRVPR